MRYIKILCIAVVVLVFCIGTYAIYMIWLRPGNSDAEFSCASASRKPVIVAFGDSLVAGYGAPEQQGFVGPLSKEIGVTIQNEGESGDTTGQALTRLPIVLALHPDIVLVLLGGNDALQQIPLATTKANIEQILSTLAENHVRVVLIGVLGGFPVDPFAPMFSNLSAEYKTLYVPNILSGLITNNKYMYDEVHPNAAGYDIAAERIYPVLNKACEQFDQGT